MKSYNRKFIAFLLTVAVAVSVAHPMGSPVRYQEESNKAHQDRDPRGSPYLIGKNSTTHTNETETEESSETSTTDVDTSTEGTETNETETSETEPPETSETDSETSEQETHTDSTSTSSEEEEEDPVEYKVEVKSEETAAEVKTVVSNATVEQEFKAALDFSSVPEVKVEYISDTNSMSTSTELTLRFDKLVEFVDKNANGIVDQGEQVLNQIPLETLTFLPIELRTMRVENNQTLYILNVTESQGLLQIIFIMSGTVMDINNTILRPTSLKMDFVITDFPFSSANSSLQFELSLKSQVETSYDEMEKEISSAGDDKAFFSWEGIALYDGTVGNVSSSVRSQGEYQIITLGYLHAKKIVHDPEIGVDPEIVKVSFTPSSTTSPKYSIGNPYKGPSNLVPQVSWLSAVKTSLIATVVFLAIPVLLLRRKEY